jgi:hypothetical protein
MGSYQEKSKVRSPLSGIAGIEYGKIQQKSSGPQSILKLRLFSCSSESPSGMLFSLTVFCKLSKNSYLFLYKAFIDTIRFRF